MKQKKTIDHLAYMLYKDLQKVLPKPPALSSANYWGQ